MPFVHHLHDFISHYGYFAVFFLVALESAGVPVPGETALVSAAVFAATGSLNIVLVVLSAAAAAILGDNAGYWVGREFGFPLIYRYGHYIRVDEGRLKVAQYLFQRHGGKIVFFGRFVAVLRAFAAFLAGVNRLPWPRFLVFNALGGIVWATMFGAGGYLLGHAFEHYARPVGLAALVAAVDRRCVRQPVHRPSRGRCCAPRPRRRSPARWSRPSPTERALARVRQRLGDALARGDPQAQLLGAAQEVDAHRAGDLVGVEQAHQFADAGDRLAVERDDEVAGQQAALRRRARLVDVDDARALRLVEAKPQRDPARDRHRCRRRRR